MDGWLKGDEIRFSVGGLTTRAVNGETMASEVAGGAAGRWTAVRQRS